MELILVRHAEALDKAKARLKKIPDAERALTKKGAMVFRAAIKNNKILFKGSPLILCSPYKRTRQTLDLFKKVLKFKIKTEFSNLIKPEASTKEFKKYLGRLKNVDKLIVISHEPFLSNLIFEFTKLTPERLRIKKSGLVRLELDKENYKLTQLINPQ